MIVPFGPVREKPFSHVQEKRGIEGVRRTEGVRGREVLSKLVSEHGLTGLGFFWMAVEKLILSNMPIPLTDLVKRGFRGLSRTQATDIVINSGLFHYDENEMVSLAEKVDYGIDKKSLKTYFVKLSLCAPACACVALRVAARVALRVAAGHC